MYATDIRLPYINCSTLEQFEKSWKAISKRLIQAWRQICCRYQTPVIRWLPGEQGNQR